MSEPFDAETQAFADLQAKEYGTWVCTSPIYIGGARAFNPGHPVPASHVAANPDWEQDGLVGKAGAPLPTPAAPAKTPQGEPTVIQ